MNGSTPPSGIIRTERGLTIAGTRTTLYYIMDYVVAGRDPRLYKDLLNLSEQQIEDALAYIESHRAEVDAEYQQVLDWAEEKRRYWEERNRERFAQIAAKPPPPGKEHLYAKLQEQKARLGMKQ